jgi:hypothetical protein
MQIQQTRPTPAEHLDPGGDRQVVVGQVQARVELEDPDLLGGRSPEMSLSTRGKRSRGFDVMLDDTYMACTLFRSRNRRPRLCFS